MNPVHLEYIIEVAKTGSISIASQNLNVTQSGRMVKHINQR